MAYRHQLAILACLVLPSASLSQSATDGLRRATVFIRVNKSTGQFTGSGVLVTPTGVIVTAAHVMSGATQARVSLSTGEEYDVAGMLDSDEATDIAVISIAGFGLPIAALGNSDSVKTGDRLIAVGSPLGLQGTVSDGILSAIRLKNGKKQFQVSVPVSPGSSGGPVATSDGRVIGIVASGLRGGGAENLNFLTPINYVRGRLALVAGKTPVPFSAVVANGGRSRPFDDSLRYNDLARLNWLTLDGAQSLDLDNSLNKYPLSNSTRYSVTRGPDGVVTVELVTAQVFSSARDGRNVLTGTLRTLYRVGASNDIVSTYVRRGSAEPVFRRFVVAGPEYTIVTSDSGERRGFSFGAGLLPLHLLDAAIAAYPGELPNKLSFWIWDSPSDAPTLARFELMNREAGWNLPLTKSVTGCNQRAQIYEEVLPVSVYAMTIGVSTTEVRYLTKSPHLRIVNDVKCVRVP